MTTNDGAITPRSADLKPGTRVRYKPGNDVVVLARRKTDMEHLPMLDGWWIEGGGGLADVVLDADDSEWEVLDV